MWQNYGIVIALAALTGLGAAGFQMTRQTAAPLAVSDLTVIGENAATSLLSTGVVIPANTTWTSSDSHGNTITYTIKTSSSTAITLTASNGPISVTVGAQSQ